MDKKLYKAGFWTFAILLILAIFFYKERTIILDVSYYLFYLVKDADFCIQRHRYIAAFPELLPLIARRAGASLTSISMLYSIGFILYHFVCYVICGSWLKQYRLAVLLLVTQIVLQTEVFYWCLSELLLGMSLLYVLVAMMINIKTRKQTFIRGALVLLFIPILATAHPLMLLMFMFVMLYLFLNTRLGVSRKQVVLLTLLFVIAFLIKKFVFASAYDDSNYGRLKNFLELFPYWNLPMNKQFIKFCITRFYWLPIITVLVFTVYIKQKRWWTLMLFTGSLFGYILIVNVMYPDNQAAFFYIENLYMPLSLILALPLVLDVWPYYSERSPKLVSVVFALIALSMFVRVYIKHDVYTTRLCWERDYLDKNLNEKLIISPAKVPQDTLLMSWGTPYEFWLLSTTEYDHTASICVHENVESVRWMERNQDSKLLLVQWGVFSYNDLPTQYFKLTDTTGYYKVID